MRRLIAERKRWHAFGHGTIKFLHPENAKVLAFIREFEEETVLVVANLSRFTQAAEIDLCAPTPGVVPMEIFSRTKFPEIASRLATMFTLGPHDFYWLALRRKGATASAEGCRGAGDRARTGLAQAAPAGHARVAGARAAARVIFKTAAGFPRARQLREFHITEEICASSRDDDCAHLVCRT